MNRKTKFPCTDHVWPHMEAKRERLKDLPLNETYLTKEELESHYVPTCANCRDSYKSYSRETLFATKFWDGRIGFSTPWGLFKFYRDIWKKDEKSGLGPTWIKKNLPKRIFYHCQKGWDGCWYTHSFLMMFNVTYNYYEFSDLVDGPWDLSELKEYKYKQADPVQEHQIKVVRRFQRMFHKDKS